MKRILILGSKGMAGHILARYLHNKGKYYIAQIARGISEREGFYNVDVTDSSQVERVISEFSPDIILNCIGILNKDAEDNPDKAIFINSYLPHFLARKAMSNDARLIHISTDCVFSGRKGNYAESDPKDGIGYYAQSKALGEVDYGNNLTIRTSIIGPELNQNGIGLLHWFLTNKSDKLNGYTNAFWSGVTTLQLAYAVENAIDHSDILGLIHLTNGQKISKYDLLVLFNEVFHTNRIIEPYPSYFVDKSLNKGPMSNRLGLVPSYKKMLEELKAWIIGNEDLYSENYRF